MKNFLLFLVIFLGNIFTHISFASSGELVQEKLFRIEKITVINNQTISILFNQSLAKEPLDLKIYDINNELLPIINTEFPKFDTINNEALVTLGKSLEKTATYHILVTSALSMNGEKIEQKEIEEATLLETESDMAANPMSENNNKTDLNAIFQKSLKNNESSSSDGNNDTTQKTVNTTNTTEATNSTVKDPLQIVEKKSENKKENVQDKIISQSNIDGGEEIRNLEVQRLPKTGPNAIYLLLFAFVSFLPYFIFINLRKGN